jgi:tRNA threonylcarbamoyladenosine biosynthesis protein TsaE
MDVNFTLQQIDEIATAVAHQTKEQPVLALHGEMGAGKTTFTQALCTALGVVDAVSSPTYSIINQYKTNEGQIIYHMDLYRLKDEEEAVNAGVEDCLYSGNICIVEWPEILPQLLPENTLHVTIAYVDSNTRKLSFNL